MVKNKKKLIIELIVLLLLIIVSLVGIIQNIKKREKTMITPASPFEETEKYLEENKILTYKNFARIIAFDGLDLTETTKYVEEIVTKYIPKLYNEVKDMNNSELEEYFNNNKSTLSKKLSVKSSDDLAEFINDLELLDTELDLYDYCEYLEDDSEAESSNTYLLSFRVYYRNGSTLDLNIELNKNK